MRCGNYLSISSSSCSSNSSSSDSSSSSSIVVIVDVVAVVLDMGGHYIKILYVGWPLHKGSLFGWPLPN